MIKRLFPTRWARITAWTTATIAWSVSVIATQTAGSSTEAATLEPTAAPEPASVVAPVTQEVEAIPIAPEDGLLIIRFTPAPPPPPRVITQTVVVGGGGGSAAPGFSPTPITKVASTGS